jgi:hypothetical protein
MSNQVLQFRQLSTFLTSSIRGAISRRSPVQLIGGGVLLFAMAFTIQFLFKLLMLVAAPLLQAVAVGLILYGVFKLWSKTR